MKRNHTVSSELTGDVETLLKDSILAEATAQVEKRFEEAWERLEPATRELLGAHFDGATVAALSQDFGLSEAATEAWLKKAKRELVQLLRTELRVRQ